MTLSRINDRVEALGSAWEQFKQVNDRRLNEIEKKGSADSLTVDHLNRINNAMDGYKSRVDMLETAMMRPSAAESVVASQEVCEHKEAFRSYLRKGEDSNLSLLETKALSVGSDADGGYLVTSTMSDQIATYIYETSPMRQLASVQTISTDTLDVIQDHDEAAASWTTETGAVSSATDSPQINKVAINTFELYAMPKATQKLLDDSSIDVEAWLSDKIIDAFSRAENTAFISGNGTSQPKGILSYTAGTTYDKIEQVDSGSAGSFDADNLVELYYTLKEEYAKNATFLMNRATAQSARLLKNATTDEYIWQPGLSSGAPDTLMGVPVVQCSDMPVAATDSLSIAIGDFKRAYQIVDRGGIRILRDPFTDKPYVNFYTTKRVGGEVVNKDAIKILKLAA